jgi:hypothetical protein
LVIWDVATAEHPLGTTEPPRNHRAGITGNLKEPR